VKEDKSSGPPKAEESLETYFQTPSFLQSFKRITISTLEKQEEANRIFSLSLTPQQRMEYMLYMNRIFFGEQMAKAATRYTGKVYFD
jgi:hypothetical protein